ncbi:ABC transporter permease [Niallia sp. FSL W8-0635]|uniref:ABC transporter permease n=1 Tax=Niallia sp. FSL W8-0635 TaxID=2975337 RepID=UPI0030FA9AA0
MIIEKGENPLVISNLDDVVNNIEKKYKKEQRVIQWKKISVNKLVVTGSIMVFFVLLLTLLTPFIAKYDPVAINPIDRMKGPSVEHFFGTDNLGRDVFSRVLFGARSSLMVAVFVALFSTVIGTVIGLLTSYYRVLDNIMMRIMDGIMAIPEILLAIALMAALGPSKVNIIIALSIIFVPSIARTVRSAALAVKEIPFVEALKASGANSSRIIFYHILPNCMSSLLVQVTFVFAYSIIVEASLSFLGLGTPPPAPSWGTILQEGATVIDVAWWMTAFPGLAIMITVIGLNLLGDGIRDLLDPHSNE